MPPKFNPSEVTTLTLRCVGGELQESSALAPKVGPLGLNPKKTADDIMKATPEWKGIMITVKLTIQNRQATIGVIPSASSLIIRALKEPHRTRTTEETIVHNGNLTLDQVVDIAKTMRSRSKAHTLSGTVMEILGTACSIGCTVNNVKPKSIQGLIKDRTIIISDDGKVTKI